jgi:flagellar hook protein FlgE
VYAQGTESGVVTTGFAGTNNFGTIKSGALEGSNVDIAEELTMMIEGQRNYTANSKVFQTGSELMDVLVNLAR